MSRFIVQLLEQGRQVYGLGIDSQLNLLLDRGGSVFRGGMKKQEKLDMVILILTYLFKFF